MEEPIIYRCPTSPIPFLKVPAESLYDKLSNALMLDSKDEFLRLIKHSEFEPMRQYHRSRHLYLREFNAYNILQVDSPQIGMALINGETKGIIDDPQLVFKDGWTPLHLASATPSPKLINCLIQRGDPLDIPCDYAPLDLKQATPLDLALEVIDTGYKYERHLINKPWTLRCSIFELFHYVCQWQKPCLEVIRLLVQNTQDKERVRKAFLDSANEGKLVKLVALFLASPELFLSPFLGGGSKSSIDALYLNLNSLDKKTDIQRGLSSLLDVFDQVGHMLIAYIRLNDPKVWDLSYEEKSSFFIREAAQMKLGISSRDDYLLSFFKPVSQHAFEPPCISPSKVGTELHIRHIWEILPFKMKKDADIDYVNSMIPSLEPLEAEKKNVAKHLFNVNKVVVYESDKLQICREGQSIKTLAMPDQKKFIVMILFKRFADEEDLKFIGLDSATFPIVAEEFLNQCGGGEHHFYRVKVLKDSTIRKKGLDGCTLNLRVTKILSE